MISWTQAELDMRTVDELMLARGLGLRTLAERTGLDGRVAAAIAAQRYTPSPAQRRRVASVLRYPPQRIRWGHAIVVDHAIHARL